MEETILPPPQGFFECECELYLKQPWTPTSYNTRSMLPTAPRTIDSTLKMDDARLSLSLEILGYAASALIPQLKMRHISCWKCPLHNPISDEFPSLFENLVLGSLRSFFHSNHHVDIDLYLT